MFFTMIGYAPSFPKTNPCRWGLNISVSIYYTRLNHRIDDFFEKAVSLRIADVSLKFFNRLGALLS
jgi:hypothetical protein